MKVGDVLAAFDRLPFGALEAIAPGTALVIAPHPDDESLGCGGFIAEAVRQGRPPVVVIVTDGAGSHPASKAWPRERLVARRQQEAREAVAELGLAQDRIVFLGLPDTAAPTEGVDFEKAVDALKTLAERFDCDTVLAPWRHDPHGDHEAAWFMACALTHRYPARRLLAYPVWGLTLPPEQEIEERLPHGWRLDMRQHMAAKHRAVAAHVSQRGLLIDDDPDGFILPVGLLERIIRPFEVFIEP